jgi:drug/metabolite transporter (DMT)-like permease
MILSGLAFSIMSAFVKVAGERLPSQEIVLARAIVSLILSGALLLYAGVPLLGQKRGLLLLRGFVGFLGLTCVYYSLTHLPIAVATVIQYMHPVFTALLAAVFLRERIDATLFISLGLSVAGLLFVAKPDAIFGASEPLHRLALAAAIGGAFFSGVAYTIVRRLSRNEHPLTIVFYFPLVTVPLSLPTVVQDFVMPIGWEWAVLLGVGVFTQLGQVWLTHGIRHEPAGRATALSYLQVLFAAAWGLLFFSEIPDGFTLAGALLILAGALLNIRSKGA